MESSRPYCIPLINTLHIALVSSFVAVTGVLLGMTIVQRLRVRGVKMTWVSSRLGSLPVWPTVFMGLVLVFMLYSSNTVASVDPSIFLGYFLGGMLWFVAVFLSSSVIVTEYGIIPEAGRSGEAIGWGQVFDWFEQDEDKRVHFTFLYQDIVGERRRLDLVVPDPQVDRFRRLVRSKLDSSTDIAEQRIRRGQTMQN